MIKTKIKEKIKKYDKDGRLIEKITRNETTKDDTDYYERDKESGNLPFGDSGLF